jgi:hypothetical protein
MDLACFIQGSTSNERLAALKRRSDRRLSVASSCSVSSYPREATGVERRTSSNLFRHKHWAY